MAINSISAAGITIQAFSDVVNEILNGNGVYLGLLQIYGPGLTVAPNSPDGNMVDIYAQGKVDVLEQLLAIATSFDPDQAVGVLLDQRCAINGVFRMPGSYTLQPVTVTVSQPLTLQGLDVYPTAAFTVQDGNGNQYQLVTTTSFGSSGSQSLVFQAALLGPVTSAVNSITVPVTVLTGVTSVNNPTGPNEVGQAEETDSQLRIRRQNSVALPGKGWLAAMLAGLLNVTGVTQAEVFENKANYANSYGMPPHSIWIIIAGSASSTSVADAIYAKRNACPDWMNGGTGAVGTPVISGTGIASITNTNAGAGYDNAPTVEIVGDGTGAEFTATVSGGAITGYVQVAAGTGYTMATVVLNPNTTVVPITQDDGTIFDVFFDSPTIQPLWFKATLTAITGSLDKPSIAAQILAAFGNSYNIAEEADTASFIAFIKSIAPNASVSAEGVSTDGASWSTLVAPTNINFQFTIPDAGHITIS